MEAKFWLDESIFEISEAYSHNMDSKDKKDVRKIIFEHFEYIIDQWKQFENRKQ